VCAEAEVRDPDFEEREGISEELRNSLDIGEVGELVGTRVIFALMVDPYGLSWCCGWVAILKLRPLCGKVQTVRFLEER